MSLTVLHRETALAIAAAAAERSRDERAVAQYLGLGRRVRSDVLTADFDAFDSNASQTLRRLLLRLSAAERRELLALVQYAKSPSDFAAAMRRTFRVPPDAQVGYLMGRRLERDIPVALDKLDQREAK